MRVAAIDIGTNTTRLLVAEASSILRYRDLDRRLLFTRLGQGVDSSGRITPEALSRTLDAIGEFCAVCGEYGVKKLRLAATSAVRDASNRAEFLSAAGALAGVEPELLGGGREAALSFRGAVIDLEPGRYLVCDIGGGSTEFCLGSTLALEAPYLLPAPERPGVSVDLGSVRLTERHLVSDPASALEIARLEAEIDKMLEQVDEALTAVAGARLVGVAGTVTSLAAIRLGLEIYDPVRTHLLRLSNHDVDRLYRSLAGMTLPERRAFPSLPEGRADVIVAGAAILWRVMARWDFPEVIVSEKDILDGLVLEILEEQQ